MHRIYRGSAVGALGLLLLSAPARAELTLTFGGDMNFNASRVPPRADGAVKGGKLYSFRSLLNGLRPEIDGAVNFTNVETVVSPRALPPTGGRFVFNTHPNALRAAADVGFNLFNLSNNHVGDHGPEGLRESRRQMELLSRERPVHFAGLGNNRAEALEPAVFDVAETDRRYRIAMLSLTGVSNTFAQAGPSRAGTLYLHDPQDFRDAMAKLKAVRADYKILSFHWGTEGRVNLDPGQRKLYHRALSEGDADLILGHHPHRVRPVEKVGHKVIFYSLGNFLMLGAANITGQPDAFDYGLLGKLHLSWDGRRQRLVAKAAEAVPLTEMQLATRLLPPADAGRRIAAINSVGDAQLGTASVRFQSGPGGRGVSCLDSEGEAAPGPRAKAICGRARAGRPIASAVLEPGA